MTVLVELQLPFSTLSQSNFRFFTTKKESIRKLLMLLTLLNIATTSIVWVLQVKALLLVSFDGSLVCQADLLKRLALFQCDLSTWLTPRAVAN